MMIGGNYTKRNVKIGTTVLSYHKTYDGAYLGLDSFCIITSIRAKFTGLQRKTGNTTVTSRLYICCQCLALITWAHRTQLYRLSQDWLNWSCWIRGVQVGITVANTAKNNFEYILLSFKWKTLKAQID